MHSLGGRAVVLSSKSCFCVAVCPSLFPPSLLTLMNIEVGKYIYTEFLSVMMLGGVCHWIPAMVPCLRLAFHVASPPAFIGTFPGFSLMAGGRLKNRLLRVLTRLLFQEIKDGETGTRLPSGLLLHPSSLLQNLIRTLHSPRLAFGDEFN